MPRKAEPKPVETNKPKRRANLTPEQWAEVRQEWDAGQLAVAEIARRIGVGDKAILNKARRENWPEREAVNPLVRRAVTFVTGAGEAVTSEVTGMQPGQPRLVLTAFQRTLDLLLRHRKQLGDLNEVVGLAFAQTKSLIAKAQEQGRQMPWHELESLWNVIMRAAQALAKLQPLERRAFGIGVDEAPSEADLMTTKELELIKSTVEKALGEAT